MRKWLSSPTGLRRLVSIHNYEFWVLGWVGLGVLSLTWPMLLLGWLALTVLGVGIVASQLGVRGALAFALDKSLGAVGLIVGFVRGSQQPEDYPIDSAEIVRRASTLRSHSLLEG